MAKFNPSSGSASFTAQVTRPETTTDFPFMMTMALHPLLDQMITLKCKLETLYKQFKEPSKEAETVANEYIVEYEEPSMERFQKTENKQETAEEDKATEVEGGWVSLEKASRSPTEEDFELKLGAVAPKILNPG